MIDGWLDWGNWIMSFVAEGAHLCSRYSWTLSIWAALLIEGPLFFWIFTYLHLRTALGGVIAFVFLCLSVVACLNLVLLSSMIIHRLY